MWRDEDVECRLTYLERALCGHAREGDVPGFEIPSRYFQYVRSGDARPLEAVLEHNRLDIISLAMLTARASQLLDDGPSAATTPREASAWGARTSVRGCTIPRRSDALSVRTRTVDRRFDASATLLDTCAGKKAAAAWRELLGTRQCPPAYAREATEALGIHHEHRARDLDAARTFALQSLRLQATAARQDAVKYRLARLDRKLGVPSQPLFR